MALGDNIYIGTSSGAAVVAAWAYFAPRVRGFFQARRDNADLLEGRPEAPGIPALPPMGTRVASTEKKVDALTLNVAALTLNVGDLDSKVDEILAQFKPNGGNSMRDKINVLVDKDASA